MRPCLSTLGGKVFDLTEADYAAAYRAVDRRADRERQIELIMHLGQSLDRLTQKAVHRHDAGHDARTGRRGGALAICRISLSEAIPRSAR